MNLVVVKMVMTAMIFKIRMRTLLMMILMMKMMMMIMMMIMIMMVNVKTSCDSVCKGRLVACAPACNDVTCG